MTDGRESQQVGWTFLWSGRWIGYYALLVIFAIACVLLGNWQFDRRAEARAEISRIDQNYDSPAVPISEELQSLDAFDEDTQKWRTVTINGEYVGDPYLARNRPGPSGGVGSNLIQALRTSEGHVFFVDRGWVGVNGVTAESGEFDEAALPPTPDGAVQVEARLRASESEVAGRTSSGQTVASINIPEIARLSDTTKKAYTQAYGMLVSEAPAGEHGVLPPRPERDEGPHLSYALQWYVFIIIALVGVGYAARREYRGLNADSATVVEQDRRSAERQRRRGPTDADIEDALLDAS